MPAHELKLADRRLRRVELPRPRPQHGTPIWVHTWGVPGNHTLTKRGEKAAIKKALNSGTFVLPIHDFPARVDHGRVVARLKHEVPGPEWPVEEFAAEFAEPVAAD